MNPDRSPTASSPHPARPRFKDAILDRIAGFANVAQFVSFGPSPDLPQRYSRVRGYPPNHRFASPAEAIRALLAAAPDRSLNVRSFAPDRSQGSVFIYGLQRVDGVFVELTRLGTAGLYTIVNETIDVEDGGVSGVALAGLLEFAPGDTPRCVEKPGTLALPRDLGLRLLEKVYRFAPALDFAEHTRVEFSLHPLRRGFREEHTILWETEEVGNVAYPVEILWPNHFSRLIGDKAFGLLLADVLGLPVPHTVVVGRHVAPFTLGTPTGSGEPWLRTCPVEQVPGRYTTRCGWCDPFKLLAEEDPDGTAIASVLAQEGVEAVYSGALVANPDGEPLVEGVAGAGDAFMQGQAAPEPLPEEVLAAVKALYRAAAGRLGPVRLEWVYDGKSAWVVQLHQGATPSSGRTIYPGEAARFHRFEVARGLEALRALVAQVAGTGEGILLVGSIGITSHLGDVLRKASIPSRIESA
jgi:hypothetical protein